MKKIINKPVDFVPEMYNATAFILHGTDLGNLREAHEITDTQKSLAYSHAGEIDMELFSIKRFKNGKTIFTFPTAEDAELMYNALAYAKQKEYKSKRKNIGD